MLVGSTLKLETNQGKSQSALEIAKIGKNSELAVDAGNFLDIPQINGPPLFGPGVTARLSSIEHRQGLVAT